MPCEPEVGANVSSKRYVATGGRNGSHSDEHRMLPTAKIRFTALLPTTG